MISWILALGLLFLFFNNFLESKNNPNQTIAGRATSEYREIVLQRNDYGHYVASGTINGHPVTFMLDTGATEVAIPSGLAREIGLQRGIPITVSTANGKATGYKTRIERLSLGNLLQTNVPAHIAPGLEDEVLLGMSFLKHLEIIQRGDQLTLRQYQ